MSEVLLISPVEHQLAKLMAEYGPKWGFAVPTSVQAMAQAKPQEPVDAEPREPVHDARDDPGGRSDVLTRARAEAILAWAEASGLSGSGRPTSKRVAEDERTGEPAEDETPEVADFILNGRSYEIDLGEENASKLRAVLAEYVERARVPSSSTLRRDQASIASGEMADADTDDVINVAGHRLSVGAIEAVLAAHPDVAECAVFGVSDPIKGRIPRGLVVLKPGVPDDYESEKRLCAELVKMVGEQVGLFAALKDVSVVSVLPKTRSGKILRKTLSHIADGQTIVVSSMIDRSVLDVLGAKLRG